ncbi:FAD dependent oxidoreductase [Plesiocystis pacifica SIR-1]|uniref:FAD dependent oxidoreductase n=1 Tax=Plesiocystis pacifica SIR-1 TaxID=391625 RepID=A6FYG3_9BACT|nr:tryptophan 7-halogenase [Plesiocystis pacifica]EDM81235.1 FAD dependent oxidoreductase [Plesiocystis pacifica SIR-1]
MSNSSSEEHPFDKSCDVLIIGAGLAGSCLARQLHFQMPDLSITVIDKKTSFDYWVGESTLPPWADYAARYLRLGSYLWKKHFMKHGLRFFFDNEGKDLSFDEMSEHGRRHYSTVVSFQLDRATFDRDMVEMNRELGIEVLLGCRVLHRNGTIAPGTAMPGVRIDGEQGHVVETSQGTIRCRWLVDAAGLHSPVARNLATVVDDFERLPVGTYWARYTDINDMDHLGSDEWRRRVAYTDRNLSTNHYMYRGYWIWQIPITDRVTSLGVVFDHTKAPLKMKSADDLTAFFKEHRWGRELLGKDPKALDFLGLKRLPRYVEEFASTDRWFLTGMSNSVVEPLFSSTCVFIAFSNLLIGEMIKRDRAGEQKVFESHVEHFNIFYRAAYEGFINTMDYNGHGSFEGWALYRSTFLNNGLNRVVRAFNEDLAKVIAISEAHVDGCDCSLEGYLDRMLVKGLPGALRRMKDEYVDYLDEKQAYYELNANEFLESTERPSLRYNWWRPQSQDQLISEDQITYQGMFRCYTEQMAEREGIAWNERAFVQHFNPDFSQGQRIAAVVAAMKAANEAGLEPGSTENVWHPSGPPDPTVTGWRRAYRAAK